MGHDFRTAERLLCVRLDALGDVIMSTPALRALKESRAGRRITLLTSRVGAAAAPFISSLDEVMSFQAPWVKGDLPRNGSAEMELIKQLRRRRFDAAVIFTVYSQSALPAALLCYLSKIPLRVAYCRENPYHLLTTWLPEWEPARGFRHEARRQLDLVAAVGASTEDWSYDFTVPADARQKMGHWLESEGVDAKKTWVIIHPGSTASSRRYDPAAFAAVAKELIVQHGWRVLCTGDRGEVELVDKIVSMVAEKDACRSLAGQLGLAEFAALIELAPLLISNNTSAVHIASAVKTPVVDLYALTNPQHTPWLVPHRVLNHDMPCKYCYKSVCPRGRNDCLQLVSPKTVVDAALELFRAVRQDREDRLSMAAKTRFRFGGVACMSLASTLPSTIPPLFSSRMDVS